MATASADMDPPLGDDTQIMNQICILSATWGDGTPLCTTSFKEEDMVKLCVGLGQDHPEGVLQLSDTETVLAFQYGSDMMATMCCLTVATVWHGEPIKLCTCPPMNTQVKDYVATRSSHPSGTEVHVLGKGWIPDLSSVSPT